MITLKRTTSSDPDFQSLVKLLDETLKILDGDEHAFYAALNTSDTIKHAVVAYEDGNCVGCGAIRAYADNVTEVKRMYVLPEKRGRGIASVVLKELETWAQESGSYTLILETGKKQKEAINLYIRSGYEVIPSYGKYKNVENSICFSKKLPAI